jgi:pathogenesis-related protein 1
MKITAPLALGLIASLISLPSAFAGDKKKDKLEEWQRQQRYQQQPQLPQPSIAGPIPSRPSRLRVQISVVNRGSKVVGVFWVDYNGNLSPFGTIAPGAAPLVMDTYAGHSWQFFASRQLIKSYVTSGQPSQVVVISDGGVRVSENAAPDRVIVTNQDPNDVTDGNGAAIHRRVPVAPVEVNEPVAMQPQTGGFVEPKTGEENPVIADFLRVHNQARSAVGVPPLTWSTELAENAQLWADKLEATGEIKHSPPGNYGENLAAQTPPFVPADAARLWLAERKQFQPGQTDFNGVGHYTQMVWRDTTRVGYGIATVQGMTVVVANYEPAGNIGGQSPF